MRITIVGAGAAGMMAAASAREHNSAAEINLIEKNAILGHKVIISGGGRCNVTTGVRDVRKLLTHYPRGNKFLTSAMYAFPPEQVFNWFEDHGVSLKTEADNRVFPQSNDGNDIVNVFEELYKQSNISVVLGDPVTIMSHSKRQFTVTLKSGKTITADMIILTTGGQAYRHTGSTGDGYTLAESCGHTITQLSTSLNSFIIKERWPTQHAGVSFSNVRLQLRNNKKIFSQGPIVLTHEGISGPAVFALAAQVAFVNYTKEDPLNFTLDFIPDKPADLIANVLDQAIEHNPNKPLVKTIHRWLPFSIIETMFEELNINQLAIHAETSKKTRRDITTWLTACPLSACGRGSGAEFVTAGGIDTNEVNPNTMESKFTPGLFFAGEILNIDGYTGGFNLQAAWATGYVAGKQAVVKNI